MNPTSFEDEVKAQRQRTLEEYLEIRSSSWTLNVPAEYEAHLLFRNRKEVLGKFEAGEKRPVSLLFMFGPARNKPGQIQVVFGCDTARRSATVEPRSTLTNWNIKYGSIEGKERCNLFEIVESDGPLIWCELHLKRK